MRWRWCSDAKDVGKLELKGGRSSSHLLGLGLDGSDARLEGCGSSGGSRGGSGHGYHGSLLLVRHGLDGYGALTGGSDGMDGGRWPRPSQPK
jgi:hypothetical protein